MNDTKYDAMVASIQETMRRDDLPKWQHKWRQLPAPVATVVPAVMAQFYQRIGAKVLHADGTQVPNSENAPVYNMIEDEIHLPPLEAFPSAEEYMVTAFHEVTHWSGRPGRLTRPIAMLGMALIEKAQELEKAGKPVPEEEIKYMLNLARCHEEMVAEIGSLLLASAYGISPDVERAAKYIKGAMNRFPEEHREQMFEDAVGRAKTSTEYLLNRNVTSEVKQ